MEKVLALIVCVCFIGYGVADHGYGFKPIKSRSKMMPRFPVVYATYQKQTAHCVGSFFCALHKGKYGAEAECVNAAMICNGQRDCLNGADEHNCPPVCKSGSFLCNDRKTCGVPCNGHQDCPGGEDEKCPADCFCGEGTFKCPGEDLCLPANKACNGIEDCLNGHDEKDCSAACKCDTGYVCEGSGQCIQADKFCDGTQTCENNDDESFCPKSCFCTPGEYICDHTGNDVHCINQDVICDRENGGDIDCPFGDDENELVCEVSTTTTTTTTTTTAPP